MKILFFGDSITDMSRNRNENAEEIYTYGSGYPMLVASALYRKNPLEYQVINRGIGGDRSVDLYARIKRDVWNLNPDVLSILVGINDIWHELNEKDGVEIDRFEKIYAMMIEETLIRLPNVKIILCEPFVLKGKYTQQQFERFQQVYRYAKIVKGLAEGFKLYFLPLQKKLQEAEKKYGAEKYLYDGVHPSVAGATLIADAWMNLFRDRIQKDIEKVR